ncbi:MAG: hypothetical protein ABIR24_15160 [Verrucomicrobiota bacterium]
MSKTLTIRLADEELDWLEEQEKKTHRSKGTIVKQLLRTAKSGAKKENPLSQFCGDLVLPKNASRKKGFTP